MALTQQKRLCRMARGSHSSIFHPQQNQALVSLTAARLVQAWGTRHCMVQWTPVFKKLISVLPSNGLSADSSNLEPKPASPILPIAGPSVSSQLTLSLPPVID